MLVASGLSKRYGPVTALDGCDLRARRGRMLGFLGPNGSGKTTMMRAVFGLVALDAGAVTWDGGTVTRAERTRFGYMPEQRGLYPKMAVGEQLAYLGRLRGLDAHTASMSARRWLAELGLADRVDAALETLSHGNQQRVQLAASLVHDPELLVLDEPFSGLDPLGVQAMEHVLRTRAAAGVAIVFSSHQLDLVQSVCDDVVVIHQGRNVLAGELAELRAASRHRRAVVRFASPLTWDAGADLPGVQIVDRGERHVGLLMSTAVAPEDVLAAARRRGDVVEYRYEPPSLSELFREAVQR